ncbi:4Fe-4S dicluster domain-containing protein, partial [bacterium]|nr:4Fe-4S dicluster domain-containing protein [bacterium]
IRAGKTQTVPLEELMKRLPNARWHQFEAVHRDQERAGALMAFGEDVTPVYDFKAAKVVLALDADFLSEPSIPRYSRDFAESRRLTAEKKTMSRLYAVEPSPSATGAMADHRLPARAGEIENIAGAVAQACGLSVTRVTALSEAQTKWVKAVAEDLKAAGPDALVVAGAWQSPVTQALAHAINSRLGAAGKTVRYIAPVEARPGSQVESLQQLVGDMRSGKVETLVILGGNPVYTAPADLDFGASLAKVKNRVHCGTHLDETGSACNIHIPEAHYLEQWSDARAYEGTASIVQPLIAPIFGGKSYHEVVAALGGVLANGYDLVRAHWKSQASGDFDRWWVKTLNAGVIAGTESAVKRPGLRGESAWAKLGPAPSSELCELVLRPDATVFDGRFANNGWLQELPKPITLTVWDNAAFISPATAKEMGIENNQKMHITSGERTLEVAARILPGHADKSISLALGYGRTKAGRLGNGAGFDAYKLRLAATPWSVTGVEFFKGAGTYKVVCTQMHDSMEGRELIRTATLAHHLEHPHWAHQHEHLPKALEGHDVGNSGGAYAPKGEADYQWGMTIDLNTCNGCNACVVACQAENNIPVVGKVEADRGRSMQWIKIHRYFEGETENPKTHFQPVACVHCEAAPCEIVCPVGATVHDNEGLNNMVYNRCVGTKYCSNNCSWHARRFNFFEYTNTITPTTKMVQNPDVTVRSRGVMEKCTYCVQRISSARIQAKNEGRKIQDGEVVTACQAACPSQSITFGDISDPKSLVSLAKAQGTNYALLGELNTRPRTSYLGKVNNPNPALDAGGNSHE